ncbi:hypothetical protein AYW79_13080 [Ferroacidibacillus organovorans]|uniref:Uncharacterized protein n=1 Tax=Ferroacidibacillus organovorans TaxID=1765683 RepID=A0A853K835_9BACL|nr:hypothetical protein AYJ22_13505 [Ferroacidibacillus organovorans]OAG92867.1 hypothetical protein AYW79_13080 [Ferroacidibacillus organovorans]
MAKPCPNFLTALEPLLNHPILIPGEDALDIRDQFLILIVQVVDALWRDNKGVRLLKGLLYPRPILFVAATEPVIVHDHDGVIEIILDVLQQPFELGTEIDTVGTANLPVNDIAPVVFSNEIGKRGFVFEEDIFFIARVVPAFAQIHSHLINFLLLHVVSPRLSGYSTDVQLGSGLRMKSTAGDGRHFTLHVRYGVLV